MSLAPKPFAMLRHGETEANQQGIAAGSVDTPLTKKGREQAKKMCPALAFLPQRPGIVIHSRLSRTRDTAALLNEEAKIPMGEVADFDEQCFGDWAGQSWSVVEAGRRKKEDPPNGERDFSFQTRVMRGLEGALEKYDFPLIVTSGGVFDALAAHYGYALEDVKNCMLYVFEPTDGSFPWRIKRYALDERGHLEKRKVKAFSVVESQA